MALLSRTLPATANTACPPPGCVSRVTASCTAARVASSAPSAASRSRAERQRSDASTATFPVDGIVLSRYRDT
jgi:hypothetical protein